jgi:hypothetical protein
MLLARNVIGDREDLANFITLSDEHETPLLKLIPKGSKPVNRLYEYQADTYDAPAVSNVPDGTDWQSFNSAAANRAILKSRVQRFDKTAAVSLMAEEVTNAAGVQSEMAREITKKLTELSRSIECAAGSDQVAYEDDGVTGDRFQGMGLWIQSAATSQLYATPAAVRPASGQITTANKADQTEAILEGLLATSWNSTGGMGRMALVVGKDLKARISKFPFYNLITSTTEASSLSTNRNQTDELLKRVVNTYESDFGSYEVHLSRWLAHENFTGGSATKAGWRGYGLHTDKWEWRWNKKPEVHELPFGGGSYKFGILAILMLVCKNPIGEVKVAPADA